MQHVKRLAGGLFQPRAHGGRCLAHERGKDAEGVNRVPGVGEAFLVRVAARGEVELTVAVLHQHSGEVEDVKLAWRMLFEGGIVGDEAELDFAASAGAQVRGGDLLADHHHRDVEQVGYLDHRKMKGALQRIIAEGRRAVDRQAAGVIEGDDSIEDQFEFGGVGDALELNAADLLEPLEPAFVAGFRERGGDFFAVAKAHQGTAALLQKREASGFAIPKPACGCAGRQKHEAQPV